MKNLKKIKRLAIIPARLGSKRIKKKNIKLFNGKPMIAYPINELKKSKIFSKIFVSTEDEIIKKISKTYGASVDFLRKKKLSKDKVSITVVLKNVISEFSKRGEFYDEVWLVYACSPLLSKNHIIKANNEFQKTPKKYPMMSMKEFEVPIEWAFEKKGKIFKSVNKKNLLKDSKSLKKKYYECASFVIFTKDQLLKNQNYYTFYSFLMKNYEAIDIDNENDWQYALNLHKIKNIVKNK